MLPVYIVTRDRLPGLRKVIPHWLAVNKDIVLTLCVEDAEFNAHNAMIREEAYPLNRVLVLKVGNNLGMGALRAKVFETAWAFGHGGGVGMADDDCFPADDVKPMFDFVNKNKNRAMGIGAMKSGYGQFIGEGMKLREPMLHTGSVGRQLAVWNIEAVISIGNVDPKLDLAFEDNELCVRGINCGYPWYLHGGVYAKQTAKRFSPGGIITQAGSLEKRMEGVARCHQYVFKKHGHRYVSKPGGPFRFFWSRMLDDKFGDKWRPYLHKGIMP